MEETGTSVENKEDSLRTGVNLGMDELNRITDMVAERWECVSNLVLKALGDSSKPEESSGTGQLSGWCFSMGTGRAPLDRILAGDPDKAGKSDWGRKVREGGDGGRRRNEEGRRVMTVSLSIVLCWVVKFDDDGKEQDWLRAG